MTPGIALTAESRLELTFSAEKRKAKAFVVTSIKSLDIDKCNPEPGLGLYHSGAQQRDPGAFCAVLPGEGQAAEDKGLQIWIMNLEKGTIDPFIGYTTDLDIYNQFDNPRLAEMVRNNWSKMSS